MASRFRQPDVEKDVAELLCNCLFLLFCCFFCCFLFNYLDSFGCCSSWENSNDTEGIIGQSRTLSTVRSEGGVEGETDLGKFRFEGTSELHGLNV